MTHRCCECGSDNCTCPGPSRQQLEIDRISPCKDPGRRVRLARQMAGLSLDDLSTLLQRDHRSLFRKVDSAYLNRVEINKETLTVVQAACIAGLCAVSLPWLQAQSPLSLTDEELEEVYGLGVHQKLFARDKKHLKILLAAIKDA